MALNRELASDRSVVIVVVCAAHCGVLDSGHSARPEWIEFGFDSPFIRETSGLASRARRSVNPPRNHISPELVTIMRYCPY